MGSRTRFTVWAALNLSADLSPPQIGYICGDIVDEDLLEYKRTRKGLSSYELHCPKFNIALEAVVDRVLYFRRQSPGRIHFSTREALPEELIEFVELHPEELEMTFSPIPGIGSC